MPGLRGVREPATVEPGSDVLGSVADVPAELQELGAVSGHAPALQLPHGDAELLCELLCELLRRQKGAPWSGNWHVGHGEVSSPVRGSHARGQGSSVNLVAAIAAATTSTSVLA
jgi:hypothetical protein